MVAAVIGAVVFAAGGGWAAGSRVQSPAQAAADRQPPDASLVTAEVVQRPLSSTLVARGTVRYGEPNEVTLPTSPSADGAATVTRPATKGATLAEGDVALEVGGRPVIVLPGNVPMYRDIGPGDRGDDVRQLEEALERLGFAPGAVDGVYDAATEGAVDAWYRTVGYDARGPSDAERSALRAAREAVSSAEDRLLQAETALDTAAEATDEADLAEAEGRARATGRAVEDAERAAELARDRIQVAKAAEQTAVANLAIARSRVDLAQRNHDVAAGAERTTRARESLASRSLSTAVANQLRDDARATAEVTAREHAVTAALARLRVAELTRDELEARAADADSTNDPSDSELEGARAAVTAANDAVVDARADLGAARLAASATALAGAEMVAAATVAVDAAKDATLGAAAATQASSIAVDEAKAGVLAATASRLAAGVDAKDAAANSTKAVGAIAAAHDDQLVADARVEQLREPKAVATLTKGVRNAQSALAEAQTALSELDGKTGIIVPANEVVFFPTLPLRVDEATAEAGASATAAVMTVTTSILAVDAALPVADARLVELGDTVTIRATELGIEVTGVVTEKADEAGTKGVESTQVYVGITPDEAPPDLTGASVRIAIAVESTDGEVLAVPLAAVSVAADGSSRVQVEDSPGDTRWVTVEPGLSADGMVEVTPDGELAEGDLVVVTDEEP
jgi:peptidoglycan hydrolase-like protein with peptidoglycan-binding domain